MERKKYKEKEGTTENILVGDKNEYNEKVKGE